MDLYSLQLHIVKNLSEADHNLIKKKEFISDNYTPLILHANLLSSLIKIVSVYGVNQLH